MSPEKDSIIVTLSPQEVLRLEMILTDRHKEEALAFVTEMYQQVRARRSEACNEISSRHVKGKRDEAVFSESR